MFTRFYGTLAHYYEVNGEKRKSIGCHVHILKRTQNKLSHCADCDYFSISVAYEETGDGKRPSNSDNLHIIIKAIWGL